MAVASMYDQFADNSIDTAKWDESDPNSRIAETNQRLELYNPHSAARTIGTDILTSDLSASSGILTIQAYVSWTTDGDQEALGGLTLWKDANNYVVVGSRSNTAGQYRIKGVVGGSAVIDVNSGVAKGKDCKIEYNFSTQVVTCSYWNGSSWVSMHSSTRNFGTPLKMAFTAEDFPSFNGAHPIIIDNAYLTLAAYTEQYPSTTLIKSVGGVAYTGIKKISGVSIASVKKVSGLQ